MSPARWPRRPPARDSRRIFHFPPDEPRPGQAWMVSTNGARGPAPLLVRGDFGPAGDRRTASPASLAGGSAPVRDLLLRRPADDVVWGRRPVAPDGRPRPCACLLSLRRAPPPATDHRPPRGLRPDALLRRGALRDHARRGPSESPTEAGAGAGRARAARPGRAAPGDARQHRRRRDGRRRWGGRQHPQPGRRAPPRLVLGGGPWSSDRRGVPPDRRADRGGDRHPRRQGPARRPGAQPGQGHPPGRP